jgi:hypothetical protein
VIEVGKRRANDLKIFVTKMVVQMSGETADQSAA